MKVDTFLQSGKYLPKFLRDFHRQKEVFKSMHEIVQERPTDMVKRPTWIEGQCYVIDVFLWFMARRGYTLQRTRVKCEDFRDLDSDVAAVTKRHEEQFAQMLKGAIK